MEVKSEDPREYFMPGHQYSRQDIHDRFGAQRKGPVATPHDHLPYLFLFVRLRKEANAQWSDNVLYYTGTRTRTRTRTHADAAQASAY
jgi:hypothetical protein